MQVELQLRDKGWTSPWIFSGEAGSEKEFFAQRAVAVEGDMSLEMAATGALERHFPRVSSGTLHIEIYVRLQKATVDIEDADASVLKVYAADDEDNWAFRWHYPFAWPEVGANVYPRFYVIDGLGKKRKGIEPTDVRAEPDRWYRTAAILDFSARTWAFWVDETKFAVPEEEREMAWWQQRDGAAHLSKLRITSAAGGKNWLGAIRIWHDDELLASTGFNNEEGYTEGLSVVG